MSSSIIVNPEDLASELIDSDLNPEVFKVNTRDVVQAKNIVDWICNYLKINPFARQYQIAVQLFEEYCPYCSDLSLVNDMWGQTIKYIESQVCLLEHNVCPNCNKSKIDFRKDKLLRDYNELVGVAGQRCLSPETPVIKFDGSIIRYYNLEVGDWLRPTEGDFRVPVVVKSIIKSHQPGYFKIWVNGVEQPIICSDQHLWPIKNELMPTSELLVGFELDTWYGLPKRIKSIERIHSPVNLIDIETQGHRMFQHTSGLKLHNSGKTALAAFFISYILHQYLCLPVLPYEYFGLTPTVIRASFVASSKTQGDETVWQNFLDVYHSCDWFKEYISILKEEERRTGVSIYHELLEKITFKNMSIALRLEAPVSKNLRGRTGFICAIDELGLFDSGPDYKDSGQEVHASLSNRLRTIRSVHNVKLKSNEMCPLQGWMLNISSPKAENDPIMPLLELSKVQKKVFSFHYTTWEMNPNITFEDFSDEIMADPIGFWRDFGAQPPTASNAFITQSKSVDLLLSQEPNALLFNFIKNSENIGTSNYQYITFNIISMQPHNVNYPRVMAIDAGETDNSYTINIGYYDFKEEKTVCEVIIEIQPEVNKDGSVFTVSFEKTSQEMMKIVKPFNVVYCVSDRWNSTQTLEKIRKLKIEAWKYSINMNDFKALRSRIYNRESILPKLDAKVENKQPALESPIARLVLQIKTVKEGRAKLLKPTTGSDDIFRSWALMDIICNQNISKLHDIWVAQKRKKDSNKLGYLAGRQDKVMLIKRSNAKNNNKLGKRRVF